MNRQRMYRHPEDVDAQTVRMAVLLDELNHEASNFEINLVAL